MTINTTATPLLRLHAGNCPIAALETALHAYDGHMRANESFEATKQLLQGLGLAERLGRLGLHRSRQAPDLIDGLFYRMENHRYCGDSMSYLKRHPGGIARRNP